jgi:non-heme chloroperoxidase
VRDAFWLMSKQVGLKAAYDCVKAFSETDLTEDLEKIDVPTLIIQADDDQIVPIDDSGRRSVKIVEDAELSIRARRTVCSRPTRNSSTATC